MFVFFFAPYSEFNQMDNKLYIVLEVGELDLATYFRNKMKNKNKISMQLLNFHWLEMLKAVQVLHNEGIHLGNTSVYCGYLCKFPGKRAFY